MPIAGLVSQISMPIRVMVVLSVLFMAAWMTVLKPKEETIPPAVAPVTAAAPQSAPGQAVQSASDAVNGANARNAQAAAAADGITGTTSGATGSTAAASGAGGSAAAPKADDAVKAGEAGGLPLPLLRGIADRKVMVLLFWNRNASDDQAVRAEMRGVDRHAGKVLVHVASLDNVSDYQQITRGANVDQSPTVVVVDRNRQVQTLVGFTDRATIDQAVSDALRASR
jgi:hypothetical protein